jgi:hypothetical protein
MLVIDLEKFVAESTGNFHIRAAKPFFSFYLLVLFPLYLLKVVYISYLSLVSVSSTNLYQIVCP